MSSLTARRLNQFSFFGVLLTGIIAIFGAYPAFPAGTKITLTTGAVIVVAGFVVGQALHIVVTIFQTIEWVPLGNHREVFARQIVESEDVSGAVASKFRRQCELQFDVSSTTDDESSYAQLWPLVVGYLHSRDSWTPTMQALFSFSRGILLVSVALLVFYSLFGVAEVLGFVTYEPVYATAMKRWEFAVVALSVLGSGTLVFWAGARHYRQFMVEYAITEFVVFGES